MITAKVGSKRIEFEKGKAAIAAGSLDILATVIDTLIRAVKGGELDDQLKEPNKSPRPLPSLNVV